MQALLKKVKGGVKLVVGHGIVPAAFATGVAFIGVLLGIAGNDNREVEYRESKLVQDAVQERILEENQQLDTLFEEGELSNGEYFDQSKEINSEAHKSNLSKDIARQMYSDDENFQGILKTRDQLVKAAIGVGSTFALAAVCALVNWRSGFGDNLIVSGEWDLDEAKRLAAEKREKKQQDARERAIDEYTEEIAD